MLRIGGFAAIGGGILWFFGLLGMGLSLTPAGLWLALAVLGNLGILVALAGLSAFQAHRHPRLAWAAFAIPAFGTLLSLGGLVGLSVDPSESFVDGSITPWGLWFIGVITMLVGSAIFAAVTLRAGVLSPRAAAVMGLSALAALVVGTSDLDGNGNSTVMIVATTVSFSAFAFSWVVLGLTALRRGPIRALAPA